jgi:hypothetical protein
MPNSQSRWIKPVFILLAVILLGAGGYYTYSALTTKKSSTTASTNTQTGPVTLTQDFTPIHSLSALIKASALVIVGTVTNDGAYRVVKYQATGEGPYIYTDYQIQTSEIKISRLTTKLAKQPTLYLATDGGKMNGKLYIVKDAPEITKGEQYVIFATLDRDGFLRALAGGNAVAKRISNTTYQLPDNVGVTDKQTFTLSDLK